MKKQSFIRVIVPVIICGFALTAFAASEKVLQIFKNGVVIEAYNIEDIDYIEINDIIGAPVDVSANVEANSITITWSEVEGATYEVYRSSDNINFSLLAADLIETSYTDTNPLSGTNYYKVKAIIDGVESDYSSVVAGAWSSTSTSGNGFHMGINGFNTGLYSYPIAFLSEESLQGAYSFIDGLTLLNGTRMYNAVEKSIDDLQAAVFPENHNPKSKR